MEWTKENGPFWPGGLVRPQTGGPSGVQLWWSPRERPGSWWRTTSARLREEQHTVNTVYSGDGVLLTSTKDVVDRWRQYFKDLLNPTNTPSGEEGGPRDPGPGDGLSHLRSLYDQPGC